MPYIPSGGASARISTHFFNTYEQADPGAEGFEGTFHRSVIMSVSSVNRNEDPIEYSRRGFMARSGAALCDTGLVLRAAFAEEVKQTHGGLTRPGASTKATGRKYARNSFSMMAWLISITARLAQRPTPVFEKPDSLLAYHGY